MLINFYYLKTIIYGLLSLTIENFYILEAYNIHKNLPQSKKASISSFEFSNI